jgi:hypothetical protein
LFTTTTQKDGNKLSSIVFYPANSNGVWRHHSCELDGGGRVVLRDASDEIVYVDTNEPIVIDSDDNGPEYAFVSGHDSSGVECQTVVSIARALAICVRFRMTICTVDGNKNYAVGEVHA